MLNAGRRGLPSAIFTRAQILGHRDAALWDASCPATRNAALARRTTLTPPVIERWLAFIESGHSDELDEMLAEDAVFYKLFSGNNFRHVSKWFDTHSAVLEFTAELDGLTVEGIDMIRWNDEDKIVAVKVMIRPLKALQALVPKMGELLLSS